jgi:hypothetical protein
MCNGFVCVCVCIHPSIHPYIKVLTRFSWNLVLLICTVMFFTRIGGQVMHQSHVLGWEGKKKHRTQWCQLQHCGTLAFSECELFWQMYLHKVSAVNRQICIMAFFSMRKQDYNMFKEQVQTCSNTVKLPWFCHMASKQTELLVLVRRPPLHTLVTDRASTEPSVLVNNTVSVVKQILFWSTVLNVKPILHEAQIKLTKEMAHHCIKCHICISLRSEKFICNSFQYGKYLVKYKET